MLLDMSSPNQAPTAADTSNPSAGLRAVASLRLLTESLELQQVEAALRSGMSWLEVAEGLGVSRHAVHKKYANRIVPSTEVPRRNRP